MRRTSVRLITATLLGVSVLAVAGCTAGSQDTPDFQPSPTGPNVEGSAGVHISPIQPIPSLGGGPSGNGSSGSGSSSPGSNSKQDPLVVATKLRAPVGLSLLPDGSALVGERTTGRIVRVQPVAGRPVPTVRTLRGIDGDGDGGLLDLAVSPHYAEDNLIYAYITTAKDNRVVDFTLDGPVTPVLTGIPRGKTDNAGRLSFAADGELYVGTGDAGRPSLAGNPRSLAGKVLRINDIGSPSKGNPNPKSPVYTTGHRVVNGLCPLPGGGVFEVESERSGTPEVNLLRKGADYGWPRPSGSSLGPVATLPARAQAPGGCAVLNSRLWVTSLSGHALFSAAPRTNKPGFGAFTPVLTNRYGRLKTVVAAQDGALWLTTSNRDGHGKPVAADERVIRYMPENGGGGGSTI